MKKAISTEQTPANVARVLEALAGTPVKLAELSRDLGDEALRRPFSPGRRSLAEILAHLINTESRTHEAIVLALTINEPLLPKIHPERDYGKLMRYDLTPFAESLVYFQFRRAALLRVLDSLSDRQWARVVREEGKQRRESVYWLARGQALHEVEHVAEIVTNAVSGRVDR
jgi:hypothetical protein